MHRKIGTLWVIAAAWPCALGAPLANVDPNLGTRRPISPLAIELAKQGKVALHVYVTPGLHLQATGVEQIASYSAGDVDLLVMTATVDEARALAAKPGVLWVEQAPEPAPRNDTVRLIVQNGATSNAPFDAAGLDGSGQLVGVIDLPLDWDHCAFDDPDHAIGPTHRKIEAYNAPQSGVNAHGTHVCGTLAGDSMQAANLRGVATGARLCFNTIPTFDESPLLQRLELHMSQGAAVHSNSWGDDQSSAYGGLARAVDEFCWEHDEQLVVFAVSNGSALKTPENAKNALAVAATQDSPMQQRFCIGAAGPTTDGRRKPDLVAPGCSVFSAYPFGSGCPTVFNSGTSMATPAVAGAALIARQYLMQGRDPDGTPDSAMAFIPSGALLKAVLIAGAADLTDEPGWPSAHEGWGRVMLVGSLPRPGTGRSLLVEQGWNNAEGSLTTGDAVTLRFDVTSSAKPLRVVLAWHDAPGGFGATDPVINDLDLSIETPSGAVFLGNAIDILIGESVTGGAPDARNNVEVIAISSPTPGRYAVRVDGASINEGSQGYGLAIVGAVTHTPAPCNAADLAEPFGILDLADVNAFAAGFRSQDTAADLVGDGVFDLSDVTAFIAGFTGGCP
ncbi:MAG: S8 family serine peptidase [Phycisphaeraceae bacterium]|nr:MAG: S8 family serine peptidase [Phycisphaeraceae bacterium]